MYYYGRFMNFIVLVMEKVGESLKRLLDATQKLSLGTVARIGKQMVNEFRGKIVCFYKKKKIQFPDATC